MTLFRDLKLTEAVLRSLEEMGFEEPTPVQARAIPCLMDGRDVVAQALTGTGKTAAFGIPLVECIDPARNIPQAVVLAPTRELAVQVSEHLSWLGRHRGVRLLPIYGGQPIDRQLGALRRGVHAIVATPGRLMDHMRRGTVDLGAVRLLVLDEADQMLQMGFQEDVEYIISHLPEGRVTALFSATMPKPILDIVGRYMRAPEVLRLSKPQALTVPEVEQVFYLVPFPRKFDALARVLDARQPERALVFCATKRMVDEVVERLQGRGYSAEGLHGDISQSYREKVLRSFRDGRIEVLIATDVAARGLDVPDVTLVVNFDIPPDPEYYVHRIGRTGRVGKGGEAITFVNPREMRELKAIERATGAHIKRADVPAIVDAEEREAGLLVERLQAMLAKGGGAPYRSLIEQMMDDHDPVDVAAAAIALAAAQRGPARGAARASADSAPSAGQMRAGKEEPGPSGGHSPRAAQSRGSSTGGAPPPRTPPPGPPSRRESAPKAPAAAAGWRGPKPGPRAGAPEWTGDRARPGAPARYASSSPTAKRRKEKPAPGGAHRAKGRREQPRPKTGGARPR